GLRSCQDGGCEKQCARRSSRILESRAAARVHAVGSFSIKQVFPMTIPITLKPNERSSLTSLARRQDQNQGSQSNSHPNLQETWCVPSSPLYPEEKRWIGIKKES